MTDEKKSEKKQKTFADITKKELEIGRPTAFTNNFLAPATFTQLDTRTDNHILKVSIDLSSVNFKGQLPQAGDVVGIFPKNNPADISRIIAALKDYEPGKNSIVSLIRSENETEKHYDFPYAKALENLQINPVNINFLTLLQSKLTANQPRTEAETKNIVKLNDLIKLCKEDHKKGAHILEHTNISDILEAFPHVITLEELIVGQANKANYRRVYTLSDIGHETETLKLKSLGFAIATGVKYTVPPESFGSGKTYPGLGSGYIERLHSQGKAQDMEIFIQWRSFGTPEKSRDFFPYNPEQTSQYSDSIIERAKLPLLIVAVGAGVSAATSILKHREELKNSGFDVGQTTLLFGLRDRKQDYLFESELKHFEEAGLISKILLAESRVSLEKTGKKEYVQDFIAAGKCADEITQLASKNRALVICGDKTMGKGVTDALEKIIGKDSMKNLEDNRLIMQSTSGQRPVEKSKKKDEPSLQPIINTAMQVGIKPTQLSRI